jgi:predicted RNase H-like HicB family nuclease
MDEALANIREAIEACMPDMLTGDQTTFIGVRDLEIAES